MRKEYDFTGSIRYPYAKHFHRQGAMRIENNGMDKDRIIANGRTALLKDAGTQKKIGDAMREIRMRYEQEMKGRTLIARINLWFQMRKELRAAAERIAPSRGCYLKK